MSINMHGNALICFIASILTDQLSASYTKWKVHNNTDIKIETFCTSDDITGLNNKATFSSGMIDVRSTYTHTWGSAWYNDGMGLNPAKFNCRVTSASNPNKSNYIRFKTGWNELVKLKIDQIKGQLVVTKIPENSDKK